MHIIAKRKFSEAARKYPQHAGAIMETYQVLNRNSFVDIHSLKQVFKTAERFRYDKDAYAVDIAGNHVRLIGIIYFMNQKLLVKHFVDHKGYDEITKCCRKGGSL